jgi:hypothetical protein
MLGPECGGEPNSPSRVTIPKGHRSETDRHPPCWRMRQSSAVFGHRSDWQAKSPAPPTQVFLCLKYSHPNLPNVETPGVSGADLCRVGGSGAAESGERHGRDGLESGLAGRSGCNLSGVQRCFRPGSHNSGFRLSVRRGVQEGIYSRLREWRSMCGWARPAERRN